MEEGSSIDVEPDAQPQDVFVAHEPEIMFMRETTRRGLPKLVAKATVMRLLLLLAVAVVAHGWKGTFLLTLIFAAFARSGDATLALLPFIWFIAYEKLVAVVVIFVVMNYRVMLMGRREIEAAFNEI